MAKNLGWITIWIHPQFIRGSMYSFVDYSFPNIYDALYKIKGLKFHYVNEMSEVIELALTDKLVKNPKKL